jgi:hypothetical protein
MLLLLPVIAVAHSPGAWDSNLQDLRNGSFVRFGAAVAPLGNMTALSYTSTWGSYYNNYTRHSAPPGWQRSPLESNPDVGMRAIVFLSETAEDGSIGRIVVAFRGTDLDITKPSGQADSCADALLFENSTRAALPKYCNQFK